MVKLASALLFTAADAYKFPKFSWDTLPVTWHGSFDNELSDDAILGLSKYAAVTLEKNPAKDRLFPSPKTDITSCQVGSDPSACGCCAEDYFVEAFKKLKQHSPDIMTIAYTNSIIAYPWYHASHDIFLKNESYWLRNADGDLQHNIKQSDQTWYTWNFADPAVVEIYKEQCMSMVRTGAVDSCYADGCPNVPGPLDSDTQTAYTNNKRQMLADLQKETPGIVLCGSGGGTMKGVMGASIQNWGKKGHYSVREIPILQNAVKEGVMFEAKGGAVCTDNQGNDPNNAAVQTELAAFLVAAGQHSYYRCGGWGHTDTTWYSVYDMPLGAPKSDAVLKDGVYTREFASGTKVTYDTKTETGTIQWASVNSTLVV
jgi:hypothetical protein